MPPLTVADVRQKLASIRMDLVETVLGSAVDREVNIDKSLQANQALQAELRSFVAGLSILYYMSFLQAHVDPAEWDEIKHVGHARRLVLNQIDWDAFDFFRYVRDVFGHDGRGAIFPRTQGNTARFLALLPSRGPDAGVDLLPSDVIRLSPGSAHACLQMVDNVVSNARLRP